MTLIVLTVLAVAWLGYFAMWLREKQALGPRRGDGFIDSNRNSNQYFHRPVVALNSEGLSFPHTGGGARGLAEGAGNFGGLLQLPRTRQQASRRRRHVASVLIVAALASLLVVPAFGPTALAVHVMIDIGLILFAFGLVHRQQASAVNLAEVRVLYPDRIAPSDAVAMPLRRVANG